MLNKTIGGTEVYEAIFAEVREPGDVVYAIARAARELRAAFGKEDDSAVTAAHVRNLKGIDPPSLAIAYATAERTCTYWPTPGQMRELAGWSDEVRCRTQLQWVFEYLAKHGPEGRPHGGAVRFGEDETGRRVLQHVDPIVQAPAIPPEIAATLAALGSGAEKQGLRYVSQHPIAKGWDGFHGDAASRAAERIEAQWIRCSLHTLRTRRKDDTNAAR